MHMAPPPYRLPVFAASHADNPALGLIEDRGGLTAVLAAAIRPKGDVGVALDLMVPLYSPVSASVDSIGN